MNLLADSSDTLSTSWTLGQEGQELTCILTPQASGAYTLRVTHRGLPVMNERCDSPHDALVRSLDAFRTFLTDGWAAGGTVH